jgi:hypothetical protein
LPSLMMRTGMTLGGSIMLRFPLNARVTRSQTMGNKSKRHTVAVDASPQAPLEKTFNEKCRQPRCAGFSSHLGQKGTAMCQTLGSSPRNRRMPSCESTGRLGYGVSMPRRWQHRVFSRNTQQASRKCFSESLNSEAVIRQGVGTGFWPSTLSNGTLVT